MTQIHPPDQKAGGQLELEFEQERNLRREALEFLDSNPEAMDCLKRLAGQMLASKKNFSAKLLIERLRWEARYVWLTEFKINNNHTAYLARLMEERMPELKGRFCFRKTRF